MTTRKQSSLLGLETYRSEEEASGSSWSMTPSEALTVRGQGIITRTQEAGLLGEGTGLLGKFIATKMLEVEIQGAYTYKEGIQAMREIRDQVTNREDFDYLSEYINYRRLQFCRNLIGVTDVVQKRLATIASMPLDVPPEPVSRARQLSWGERFSGRTDH